jgi:hypothetical protein
MLVKHEHAGHADAEADVEPLPSSEYSREQIVALLAPNLEHAVLCVEAADQIARELGALEHLASLETAVEHAQHFLRLAQGYLTQLRRQQRQEQEQEDAGRGDQSVRQALPALPDRGD